VVEQKTFVTSYGHLSYCEPFKLEKYSTYLQNFYSSASQKTKRHLVWKIAQETDLLERTPFMLALKSELARRLLLVLDDGHSISEELWECGMSLQCGITLVK